MRTRVRLFPQENGLCPFSAASKRHSDFLFRHQISDMIKKHSGFLPPTIYFVISVIKLT